MLRLISLCFALFSVPVFATPPAHVIFGDSLSDEGRLYQATEQAFPPSPFFEGRFSNGPLWSEHLEGDRMNYAFAGAKSDYTNMLTPRLGHVVDNTGLFSQIDKFFEENQGEADLSQTTYYINIGANDFLALVEGSDTDVERFIPDIVDNIIDSADRLRAAGATQIMLMGLPNLAKIPMANDMTFKQQQLMGFSSWKFNQLLQSQAAHHHFTYVDVDGFMKHLSKHAKDYGFNNLNDACFDEVNAPCSNPDEYLYWDNKHPTTRVHQLFAESLRRID